MEENLLSSFEQAQIASIQQRSSLENRLKSGASWFYWIAGLSLVNSLVFLLGGEFTFVFGLGLTQAVDGIMWGVANELGSDVGMVLRVIGLAVNLVIVGIFALFGYLGRKKKRWVFIIGMILYGLDMVILIWVHAWLSTLFHLLALAGIYRGLTAIGKIERLKNQI